MGCSIGGRVVLNLALKHARELRALIGLQSAAYVERYYDAAWMDHPEVHGGRACGGLAYGLMSPLSPETEKWETVWHYCKAGRASSPVTCSFIRWKATSAAASAPSTPGSARSTC
jgi:pimeloyl-ACP methyl ester carboxylesterase